METRPKRTKEEIDQELYDMHAALSLMRAEVATKLGLDERKRKLFYRLIDFADWFATGWGYLQKIIVYLSILAGGAALLWGKTWLGK